MTNAQNAVSAADQGRAKTLQNVQHGVNAAKRVMHNAINAAQQDVNCAQQDINAAFGSAHVLKITVGRPYCMYNGQRCINSSGEKVNNQGDYTKL